MYEELSTKQLYLELGELQSGYGSLEEIKQIQQELNKRRLEEI